MLDISISLVTYHNDINDVKRLINCFKSSTLQWDLTISDNSKSPLYKELEKGNVHYIFNNENIGFGVAHNRVIKSYDKLSRFHLIVNPDIYFDSDILTELFHFLTGNKEVSVVAPRILFPNGKVQQSIRLLPSFFDLILRRSSFLRKIFNERNLRNNIHEYKYDIPLKVNFLLGCFLLCKTSSLIKYNGFDERFFLYMEDFDLVRRLSSFNECAILYPFVNVYHVYDRGATKKVKLLLHLINSSIKYYNKWGWFDSNRKVLNNAVLKQL